MSNRNTFFCSPEPVTTMYLENPIIAMVNTTTPTIDETLALNRNCHYHNMMLTGPLPIYTADFLELGFFFETKNGADFRLPTIDGMDLPSCALQFEGNNLIIRHVNGVHQDCSPGVIVYVDDGIPQSLCEGDITIWSGYHAAQQVCLTFHPKFQLTLHINNPTALKEATTTLAKIAKRQQNCQNSALRQAYSIGQPRP